MIAHQILLETADLSLAHDIQRSAVPDYLEPDSPTLSAIRPDAGLLVEAVTNAARSILVRDERINELETQQEQLEQLLEQLTSKSAGLLQLQQVTDARARSEASRAAQAEERAAGLDERVRELESELDTALVDLHKIAEVITASLGMGHKS